MLESRTERSPYPPLGDKTRYVGAPQGGGVAQRRVGLRCILRRDAAYLVNGEDEATVTLGSERT